MLLSPLGIHPPPSDRLGDGGQRRLPCSDTVGPNFSTIRPPPRPPTRHPETSPICRCARPQCTTMPELAHYGQSVSVLLPEHKFVATAPPAGPNLSDAAFSVPRLLFRANRARIYPKTTHTYGCFCSDSFYSYLHSYG